MSLPPEHPRDPFALNLVVAAAFFALACVRLTVPSTPFFDEVHYLPAARAVLDLGLATNLEHPPLAKQIIALGMTVLGDGPLGWRFMSVIFGTLALFAAMRAAWFSSCTRAASLLTGLFVGANFLLFVHARIAMLDVFMVAFVMVALWMFAGAVRENETGRWRLAICGVALGCAMASKWNAIPIAVLPGLVFFFGRLAAGRRRLWASRRGWPVAGMPLWEAGLWLGLVPLLTYALTFWPFLNWDLPVTDVDGLISLHREMLALQTQVPEPHPYQSNWWQWVANQRAIWYLYEPIDGAQRGVMLIGNPVTMWFGLIAMGWCAWAGWRERRKDLLALVVLYAASLLLWVVAPKAVQFYFHYFLAGMFVSGALALAVERLWQRGERLVPWALTLGALGFFAYWFPILTAAPLENDQSFLMWAWTAGWR
ncbi:phospholipid carrier-dependent glycosyltransferase [Erythrobacter arachoides]|uniref:Polyprenol-phosphate-mannose--protein mannosyltransferase n=1 Tax=Aurantiacibacter arachoides TaxID=1850444 RepID=A0A845A546_9SPHN|nr:glycosyltransferase family 39 protein [Aurantiacibacter arachoides]MXO92699.1 phospholipid carrier-dependent glycosyltransferase [Aurantiacibacter arachoides]GGD55135.1 dolichyl-phosphate-mannose--protein mannosyltransferase [Aurantiacibacter arachoides]